MDSFSFKLTLKPWKNYVPTFWSNFVDDLSKINDLKERLAALQNMKLRLKKEAARLSSSGLEPFTVSMGFLKDGEPFFVFSYSESFIYVHRSLQFVVIKVFDKVLNVFRIFGWVWEMYDIEMFQVIEIYNYFMPLQKFGGDS